jgi:hypothetical protein
MIKVLTSWSILLDKFDLMNKLNFDLMIENLISWKSWISISWNSTSWTFPFSILSGKTWKRQSSMFVWFASVTRNFLNSFQNRNTMRWRQTQWNFSLLLIRLSQKEWPLKIATFIDEVKNVFNSVGGC